MSKDFRNVLLGLAGAILLSGIRFLFVQHDQVLIMQHKIEELEKRVDYYHGRQ